MAARPWCFYYVQGEEGEAPEEPNAFQVGTLLARASQN